MKKVFFAVAVIAATALVSCNNKAAENAETADTAAVVEEVVEETLTVDSVAAPADSANVAADSTATK